MKWIGQHIYDQISRFRNDVYLEDISTGTIASGGNLGLDSNNKIVKDDGDGVTDLHGAGVDGSNNQLLTDDGDGTVTSEANLTFDGTDLFLAGSGKMEFRDTGSYISSLGTSTLEIVTDTLYVNSSSIRLNGEGTNEPYFFMSSTVDDATGPILYFQKLRDGNGLVDGDILGKINFTGEDVAGNFENYGSITGSVMEADGGDEAGKITILVANDGTEVNGITMTADKGTAAEVDVSIANGDASTTTIAGTLTMGSTAALTNTGLVAVANQSNITGLGTVSSGVWNGTKVASAYLDDDTAHLSGSQTFTGTKTLNSFKGTAGATVTNILDEDAMGSDSATALATQQSIKAYADRPARQVVLMKAGFKDALGTTKHYIPLQSELEQTTYNHEMNMFVAPYPGKLLKIMYNGSGNLSGGDVAFTFEQIPRNVAWTTPTVLETVTVTGPTNNSTDPNMATATFGAGSAFVAGDMLMVGLEYDTSVGSSNSRHFFTLVFEFDFSGLA